MTSPRQQKISEGVKRAWARRKAEAKKATLRPRSGTTAPRKATTPKLPPIKETMLVKQILAVLTLRYPKSLFWRNNSGALATPTGGFMRFGSKGTPDILGILSPSGRLVGVEVKTVSGRVSPMQEAWQADARAAGALVGVVRSVEEAIALLTGKGGAL